MWYDSICNTTVYNSSSITRTINVVPVIEDCQAMSCTVLLALMLLHCCIQQQEHYSTIAASDSGCISSAFDSTGMRAS
jgi:hypothetical protein